MYILLLLVLHRHDSVKRFRSLGVNVIKAGARFIDSKSVQAGEAILSLPNILLLLRARQQSYPISLG